LHFARESTLPPSHATRNSSCGAASSSLTSVMPYQLINSRNPSAPRLPGHRLSRLCSRGLIHVGKGKVCPPAEFPDHEPAFVSTLYSLQFGEPPQSAECICKRTKGEPKRFFASRTRHYDVQPMLRRAKSREKPLALLRPSSAVKVDERRWGRESALVTPSSFAPSVSQWIRDGRGPRSCVGCAGPRKRIWARACESAVASAAPNNG